MTYRMASFLRRFFRNTIPEWVLLAYWLAGSSLGLLTARFCGDVHSSFLLQIPGFAPDLMGCFTSTLFPLLLSAFAVLLFRSAGCYVACLIRSLSQGLMIGLLGCAYGAAAPLMTFLLLFSGLCVNAVLLTFWLRFLVGSGREIRSDLILFGGICVAIGAVDHLLIAPFLVDVMNLLT